MRQSYIKNAALLTGADVVLRLAGMGLRVYLASALGGEGMGLYQLVLAVYSLFVTLATAGVAAASTRLLAEELARSCAAAHGMLRRLLAAGLLLGSAACAAQFGLTELAARWWLGDLRAAPALRAAAFGLPCMAVSAVLRGFFIAQRRVEPNVISQLAEQALRICVSAALLGGSVGQPLGVRCAMVMAATACSEVFSTALMLLFYRRGAARFFGTEKPVRPPDTARRLWEIMWPVEGGRCLSSALHTAENMLVPACLAVYLQGQGSGGRSEAVEQYGNLKGMALPLLTFPFGLLGSLGVLLMPEITQAHISGDARRLHALLGRMLTLTGFFSALAGAVFFVWGKPLALLLYGSDEAGFYIQALGPAMPLIYIESMVDGAMKGIGEQKASFCYGVWDSVLRIAGVLLLLPRFGMRGFLFVILLSSAYTCAANTGRLLRQSGMRCEWAKWFGAPSFAALAGTAAGFALRRLLGPMLAGGGAARLAALAAGCAAQAAVCLAAAWPLGLGSELMAALKRDKFIKNAYNAKISGHGRQ